MNVFDVAELHTLKVVKMGNFVLCLFYYNFKKQNELLSHEKPWMNLKHILLGERSQLYILPLQLYDILEKENL